MSGVARGLAVLEHISARATPPTHADLVRATGMAKSTLTSVLTELAQLGYVVQLGKGYAPGSRLLSLGYQVAGQLGVTPDVPEGVHELLEQIARDAGETAIFSVEVGRGAEIAGKVFALDHAESAQVVRYMPGLGQLQPIAHTAAGYVLLAFSGRDAGAIPPETLYARTPNTLVDPAAINAELARIVERGYAHSIDRSTEGVTSIAFPWPTDGSALIGAISIVGPTPRMQHGEERVLQVVRKLVSVSRSPRAPKLGLKA